MPTRTFDIPARGHALAAGIREIDDAGGVAVRVELAPQSPFAGDAEFDTTLDLLVAPGNWIVSNGANADAINANTTDKSHLWIDQNTTSAFFFNGTRTAPFVDQTLSGDFDIYALLKYGDQRNSHGGGLLAQSTSDASDFFYVELLYESTAAAGMTAVIDSCTDAVSAQTKASITNQPMVGARVYLRLKRSGNNFSGYYSLDGKTWTQIGATTARADFSSNQKCGAFASNANSDNASKAGFDFFRTWPPYLATSPVSSVVIDSGANGAVWDMSTFDAFVNMYQEYNPQSQIGFGTLKFKYGASDTSPPALNASYLTEAQMQVEADPRGRYFKLEVQYTSANGYEQASFNGAVIDATFAARRPAMRLVSA